MDGVARRGGLETGDPRGCGGVLDVDDVPAPAVVDRVDMVVMYEQVVHASGQLLVELRQNFYVSRFAHVQNHDAVASVGGSLAANDANASVL